MKVKLRSTLAPARATEIHRKFGIQDPDEIVLEDIAAMYDIEIREAPLSGMDGCIVRHGEQAVITVRDSIRYPQQKRFVIAHELGHFFLHPDTKQYDQATPSDLRSWSMWNNEECEANLFAAQLLMPPEMLNPRAAGQDPSMNLLSSLAKDFNTTFTATAVQYVLNTIEPCALVSSQDWRVRWSVTSKNFGFTILCENSRVHGYSCAAQAIKSGMEGQPCRASDIEASFWLEEYRDNHKSMITEDSSFSPSYNRVLSLLWIHEEI